MNELDRLPIPLLEWYRDNARALPWRPAPGSRTLGDPYRVWVSEIMLQQTRVAAVLDYYQRFMAALPTVEALAAVGEDRLMKLWQGLGYYNRARNLRKAAQQITGECGGRFPDTYGPAGPGWRGGVHRRRHRLHRLRSASARSGRQRAAGGLPHHRR